ncbi:MAG: hypothetical protein JWO95_1989 [Verrucomicrobiales bacterium]|nr:hypothetical protein [Verrucomicrobiales bacterium]
MFARITFVFVLAFWLVMNFLLWRSKSVGHQPMSNKVPLEVVWKKILTAPDNSSLEILHYNERIGFCTWSANIGEAPRIGVTQSDEDLPEELTTHVTGYTLGLEGRAALNSNSVMHVDFLVKLSTNQDWQEFHGRANLRPNTWDLSANAVQERIKLQVTDDSGTWQRILKFSDLRDPEALMQKLGGDVDVGMLGMLIPGGKEGLTAAAHALKWQAYSDTMQFGHSRVGVYRLETNVFGHKIFVFVSKVGEILWVELPDKIVFRNEAFGHF